MMDRLEKQAFARRWLPAAVIIGIVVVTLDANRNMTAQQHQSEASTREQQNSVTILRVFRAIEERDDSRVQELFQPDFEIHWPLSLPYGGTFRGLAPRPKGWNATWDPLQPTAAERKMDAHVIAARGENVLVLWHQRGVSPRGMHFDGEVLGLYTFRAGKLGRAQMFYFDTTAVAKFLDEARH